MKLPFSKGNKDLNVRSDIILKNIQDGVVMVDNHGKITLLNPAAGSITGWKPTEAVSLEFHSVAVLVNQKGEKYADEDNPFVFVLKNGQAVKENDAWLMAKTGKILPISLIVSPVLDNEGRATGSVVGVFRDITAEKQEQDRKSEFISTASHEMRTPITAIEGYLQLALNEKISKVDDNARKYLSKALNSTHELGVLFQDLLTSSKAEDGRLQNFPVVVEMGETLQAVIDEERNHAQEKGLELKYELASGSAINGGKVIRPIYYVNVDPHRIREVLVNIIDNGIKYTMTGSITVRLTGDGSLVQIQVQDTGQGISEEDIPHLFQKFYRVDSSLTRSVGGTGLGLYICKKIVELYNGQVWIESVIGKGSTFFINLPRLTPEQALELQKSQAATISPLDAPR